jgi:hypothetical protein
VSILNLSQSVQTALQNDFRTGRWGPLTRQFMEQLFQRVGGASSLTLVQIGADVTALQATIPTMEQNILDLQATSTEMEQDILDLEAAVGAITTPEEILTPRVESSVAASLADLAPREVV